MTSGGSRPDHASSAARSHMSSCVASRRHGLQLHAALATATGDMRLNISSIMSSESARWISPSLRRRAASAGDTGTVTRWLYIENHALRGGR